jgi:hypothetical protein
MQPERGCEGPERKVSSVVYEPNGLLEMVAVVTLECSHSYRVDVDKFVNRFKDSYLCQKCR